jgi:hypothetical protein
VGDEQQFPVEAADHSRFDHALRACPAGVEVDHHHRLALLQCFLQFKRQRALVRGDGHQAHGTALLTHCVAQLRGPTADRLDELFEDQVRGLSIG